MAQWDSIVVLWDVLVVENYNQWWWSIGLSLLFIDGWRIVIYWIVKQYPGQNNNNDSTDIDGDGDNNNNSNNIDDTLFFMVGNRWLRGLMVRD